MTSTETSLERRIPEEGDLEAVLVAVGEFFGGCVRHRGSFLVGGACDLTRRSCVSVDADRARGDPTPTPDLSGDGLPPLVGRGLA